LILRRPHLPPAFAALKHRNYRLLWTGNLISQSGDWMDLIAFNWLVYTLTESPLQLAIANALRALPALVFTLIGGVIADRMERRKLLFITQFVMMLFAFALAILVSIGETNIWIIYLVAFGRGVATAVNQPARQSLISELVPEEDLPNAVALNSATVNLTRVIGPAIGGVLIATVGVTGAFYLNAFSFFAVLYGLYLMQFPAWKPSKRRRSMVADLADGYQYLRHEAGLRTLVILALVPMVLGQPYQTMLTVFARDVFHSGGSGLGIMQSAAALGAAVGALAVASSRQSSRFHVQMMAGLIFFGVMLVLFAVAPTMWLALPILLLIGFSNQTYQTSNNTLLQMNVAPEYRGRILSLLFLRRGLLPLGTVLAGALTSAFGPQVAVGGMAVGLVLLAILSTPYALPVLEDLGNRMRSKGTPVGPASDPEPEQALAKTASASQA
jgi:MFS family permease